LEYLQIIYIARNLESLTYIFAVDCIGLCLLLFTQLFSKIEPPESKNAGPKTEFDTISIATEGHCNQLQAGSGLLIAI